MGSKAPEDVRTGLLSLLSGLQNEEGCVPQPHVFAALRTVYTQGYEDGMRGRQDPLAAAVTGWEAAAGQWLSAASLKASRCG